MMLTTTPISESIREHDQCILELGAETVLALRSPAFESRLAINPTFQPGRFSIRTQSFIGRVSVPGLSLAITPKVSIGNVIGMIRPDRMAAGILKQQDSYGAGGLVDAVAALFQRSLADAMSRGIRSDYVEHSDRLVAVRGRVDLAKQLRSPLPLPIACTFDEYTVDQPHNRLLKAALRALLRIEGVSGVTRSSLQRSLLWFGEVTDRPPPIQPLLRKGFSRLSSHYEAPCRLAALILESCSISAGRGTNSSRSFLVDMNKVFEEFVESRLHRSLPPAISVVTQRKWSLDLDHRAPIKPDLVFMRSGAIEAVADVKYKVPERAVGKEEDLYQVVSYAAALDVQRSALIYASESDRPTEVLRLRAGTSIAVAHLTVAGDLRLADNQLIKLANWLCPPIEK